MWSNFNILGIWDYKSIKKLNYDVFNCVFVWTKIHMSNLFLISWIAWGVGVALISGADTYGFPLYFEGRFISLFHIEAQVRSVSLIVMLCMFQFLLVQFTMSHKVTLFCNNARSLFVPHKPHSQAPSSANQNHACRRR